MAATNRKFLNFVTTLPCAICGSGTYHDDTGEWLSDPCHVKSRGSGGKDEGNVIPMCRSHHVEQHSKGWRYMESVYGIEPLAVAEQVEEKWQATRGNSTRETPPKPLVGKG